MEKKILELVTSAFISAFAATATSLIALSVNQIIILM